jgi:hypothetical protein
VIVKTVKYLIDNLPQRRLCRHGAALRLAMSHGSAL